MHRSRDRSSAFRGAQAFGPGHRDARGAVDVGPVTVTAAPADGEALESAARGLHDVK